MLINLQYCLLHRGSNMMLPEMASQEPPTSSKAGTALCIMQSLRMSNHPKLWLLLEGVQKIVKNRMLYVCKEWLELKRLEWRGIVTWLREWKSAMEGYDSGTWWRLGWDDDFQQEDRGFDSHSSRHVGTFGKSFTCSCLCASAWNSDTVSVL